MIFKTLLLKNSSEIYKDREAWEPAPDCEYVIKRFFVNPEYILTALELDVPTSPIQPVFQLGVSEPNAGEIEYATVVGKDAEEFLIRKFNGS